MRLRIPYTEVVARRIGPAPAKQSYRPSLPARGRVLEQNSLRAGAGSTSVSAGQRNDLW